MTTRPRIGTESITSRMASTATWSEYLRSPWPMVRAAAIAAASVTRKKSSDSSRSVLTSDTIRFVSRAQNAASDCFELIYQAGESGVILSEDVANVNLQMIS